LLIETKIKQARKNIHNTHLITIYFYIIMITNNLDNLKNKNKMKNVILSCLLTCTVVSLSFAQLKVVAPDGNVGIGTSTPSAKFVVQGTTRVLPANGGAAAAKLEIGFGRTAGGNAFIDTHPNPGGAWVGRLLSNKNGVTTFSHRGVGQFQLRTFDAASRILLVTNNGSNSDSRLTVSTDGYVGINENSPTAPLHVTGAAVKTGGGMWGTASDSLLKKDIKDFERGLADVLKINPKTFKYNDKVGIKDTEKVHTGVIAQDFKKISPESIFTYRHTKVEYQEDDKAMKTGATSEYLGVDPSQVTWMLVNAVKEQQEIIQDLKNEVENLKTTGVSGQNPVSDHVYYSTVVLNGEQEKAMLAQNAPNPFTSNTKIDYFIPSNSRSAQMSFTDITGKEVKRLNIDHTGLGTLDVSIADMPIGIYSYSLVIDGSAIASKKMVLSK